MSNAEFNEEQFELEKQELVTLLTEFLNSDGIRNYDSSLCWGCGEVKESVSGINACAVDCLLERTRKAIG
jgi:hypothetical protein